MFLKTNSNYCDNLKKKENILEELKSSLRKYFKSSSLPKEIIEEIVCEDFINSNPSYYLYYPYLFNDYFQVRNKKTLNLLSISGFLYYKSIIIIDNIFDDKKSDKNFQIFFIANICQEETIKILSSFFPLNSTFWKTWNSRRFEYAMAYKLDKSLKSINNFSEFEALADYKSAFGKIAIDCLYHLSDKKDTSLYQALLESHKFFYVSFQIMDDIADYKEDAENGQFNIAKYELKKILKDDCKNIEQYSLENQTKLIYLKGIAENLYDKATKYLDKSLELQDNFKGTNSSFWVNEIESFYNTSLTHFLNIKGFVHVYNSEQKLSQLVKSKKDISVTIKDGTNYLLQNQLENGSWNDIFNDAGVSDVWTTSFVNYLLSEYTLEHIENKAIGFIIENQSPNGLWGYNKTWVEDADSSSFALLSLKNNDEITHKFVNKWLKFQNKDGGFTTYNNTDILFSSLNSPYIKNVDDWMQSHFCVSAVAFLVFIELNITQKNEFEKLRDYLIKKLKSDNKTLSYWWTEDIYAIYFILLGAIKNKDEQVVDLCENRIVKFIELEKELNYFFKGFLLKTLCLTNNLKFKYSKETEKLVDEISSNQFSDGSWLEGYSLKIPHPSSIKPDEESNVSIKANKGTNIVVKDYNRIFTTISCVTALKFYESRI